jgi:hypothetical protein
MHTLATDTAASPRSPTRGHGLLAAWLIAVALTRPGWAGLPEPDVLVYGAITLDGQAVTRADTDVVVEARRLVTGPASAGYRMGTDAQAGDFYALRLKVESGSPLLQPDAFQVGDGLFLVVRDAGGVRGQATFTLTGRGQVERVNLTSGGAVVDADQDGLSDEWETRWFGDLNHQAQTIAPNGQTAQQNYVAGTDPQDTNALFTLRADVSHNEMTVSFLARKAEGPGYAGLNRFYSLESSANLTTWDGVAGYTNRLGDDLTVSCTTPASDPPTFYRCRVWLQW